MLRRRPSLVVFDLDGTLVDSAPDLAYAIDEMLTRLGQPPAGEARVRGWIGNGMPMLVKRALTGEQWPEAEPEGFAEALALYMEIYEDNLCHRTRLYDGALECLQRLRQTQIKLACVTNKHSRFTLSLLKQIGIAHFFDAVASGDQFVNNKPDPESLLKTAEQLGVAPSDSLMVGDSAADAQAARRAGFMLACVPYGYHGGKGVEVLLPDLILESLAKLPGWVDSAPCQPLPAAVVGG
ncbi:MAG: phosphoglycolate phosphatase [Methylococcaceae bacterium]